MTTYHIPANFLASSMLKFDDELSDPSPDHLSAPKSVPVPTSRSVPASTSLRDQGVLSDSEESSFDSTKVNFVVKRMDSIRSRLCVVCRHNIGNGGIILC